MIPRFEIDEGLLDLGVAEVHNQAGFTLDDLRRVNRPLDQVGLCSLFIYIA